MKLVLKSRPPQAVITVQRCAWQETLAEAEGEMETIGFEMQQLAAQWKSSIIAIQRRDEALRQIDNVLSSQQEQSHAIDAEIFSYKKDIAKEEVRYVVQFSA